MRNLHKLHIITNIALITASTAVVVTSSLDVYSRLNPTRSGISPQPARAPSAQFRPGQKAPTLSGIDYSRADRTMVLFLSTTCGFCRQSAPFYRELSAKLAAKPERKLVAVFPQPSDEVAQYKQREQYDFPIVSDTPLSDSGVSGTPTMLLVSRDGRVLRSWVGAPRPQEKGAIEAAILND